MVLPSLPNGTITPMSLRFHWTPIASVVPFTYRDGWTMLKLIEEFRTYITQTFHPDLVRWVNEELDQIKANLDDLGEELVTNQNAFIDRITALVGEINNRVGPTDVKHFTVSGATPLPYSDLWPDNHVIWYEASFASGGSVTLPPNVTGSVPTPQHVGGTVTFRLFPTGDGNYVVQGNDFLALDAYETQGAFWSALNAAYAAPDELYVNVKRYGATGDGNTDDTPAVEAAMNVIRQAGGGTLFFPQGTYHMKHYVNMAENLRILGSGATLIKKVGMSAYSFFNADSVRPERGGSVSNVRMENMRFQGDLSMQVGCAAMVLHHASTVEVRNCEFVEMVITGHVFDLIGATDVVIDSCKFMGATPDGDSEAIQIDISMLGTGGTGIRSGLPTRNVKIVNCTFGEATNPRTNTVYPAPNPMGAHAFREGTYYDDVVFSGNTVTNPRTRAVTGNNFVGIIRGGMARRWNIRGNTFITDKGAPSARVIALQGITTGWLANSDPNNAPATGTFAGAGVVSDCQIVNNQFIGWGGVGNWDDTIYLTNPRNVDVSNNLFKGCGNMVDARSGYNLTINSNTYSYAPANLAGHTIGLNDVHSSVVVGNMIMANNTMSDPIIHGWNGTDTTYVASNMVRGKGAGGIAANAGSTLEIGANYTS